MIDFKKGDLIIPAGQFAGIVVKVYKKYDEVSQEDYDRVNNNSFCFGYPHPDDILSVIKKDIILIKWMRKAVGRRPPKPTVGYERWELDYNIYRGTWIHRSGKK